MRNKEEKEIVFLNQRFIPREAARLPVATPGFLYGWGLFESMRSCNGKIVYFDEHVVRLKRACVLLHIKCPYTPERLKEIIRKTVEINGHKDAYLRLTLWKSEEGTDILVTAKKYKPYSFGVYNRGFHACISSFRQHGNSFLTELKSVNYLLYRLAYAQAIKRGFDEAVILNHRGYIAEASRSNLFFIKDKELFTPSLECGCLGGITRKVIFDLAKKYNIKAYEGNFSIPDLYASEEAFLTNSLMGIMPLASIEGRRISRGARAYKLTRFFMEKYKYLFLRNGSKKDKATL